MEDGDGGGREEEEKLYEIFKKMKEKINFL